MPPSPPSPEPTGPRRRMVLAALAATLAATGCGVDLDELRGVRLDDDPTFPPPSPGPDELARRQVARDAAGLHEAALAAGLPGVAGVHAAHLEALGEPPRATPSGAPTAPQVPAEDLPAAQAAAAVTALGWLEPTTGGMARLLASVAAGTLAAARRLAADLGQPAPAVPPTALPGGGAGDLGADAAAAVSAALRGEHAAVYGWEVVAARAEGAQRDAALAALEEHERAADALVEVLEAAGRQAPVPEPGYVLPTPAARSPGELQALAVEVEERTAALHADVVAAAGGPVRRLGADLLLRSALRAAAWRGGAVALPGLP